MEKPISKEDILTREYNKYMERKIMLEFALAHQRKLDPKEMSATEILRRDASGNPVSTRAMSRRDFIKLKEKELDDVNLILATLKEL